MVIPKKGKTNNLNNKFSIIVYYKCYNPLINLIFFVMLFQKNAMVLSEKYFYMSYFSIF